MIQLTNLQRLPHRNKRYSQPGFNQDIYRALAIAQTQRNTLYTASKVAALGWDPIKQKEAYQDGCNSIYSWASKHNIKGTSQNRDDLGRPKNPAMWRGFKWLSELSNTVYHEVVDVLNKGCDLRDLNEGDGFLGHSYWYDHTKGVFSVPSEYYKEIIDIANNKHTQQKKKGFLVGSWECDFEKLLQTIEAQNKEIIEPPAADVAQLVLDHIKSHFSENRINEDALAEVVTKKVQSAVSRHPKITLPLTGSVTLAIAMVLFGVWLFSPTQKSSVVPTPSQSSHSQTGKWSTAVKEWRSKRVEFVPINTAILDKQLFEDRYDYLALPGKDPALYATTQSHPFYFLTSHEHLRSH